MKTVLITGASSGFGLKMVQDFLGAGWRVLATVRNVEKRTETFKEELGLYPDRLRLLELDVTKESEIKNIVNYLDKNENNKLDVLVNNAGFGAYGSLEDISMEQIRYQMEVNFFGPTSLIKNLLPALRKSRGKVINISSLMGRYSCPLASVYSSSKYALEGLTEGLMYELDSFGVGVCSVQPGGHRTNFVSSVNWGDDSFNDQSPYIKMSKGFKAMMDKLTARKNAPGPDGVSKTVLKLSNSTKMPRSVLVGMDAKFVGAMQVILPRCIYRFIMNTANKKIFGS
jgi:NAD(P)-dependent dehydrogenase (short-subunit alcohol dehydrogenase family)